MINAQYLMMLFINLGRWIVVFIVVFIVVNRSIVVFSMMFNRINHY